MKNEGIEQIYKTIQKFISQNKKNLFFSKKRNLQNKFWLLETINTKLKNDFYNNPTIKILLAKEIALLEDNKTTPFNAANRLLKSKKN